MNKILILSITAFLLFFSSCKKEEVKILPQSYQISESGLYPEGITYSSSEEKIYVGSYYKGKIVTVDLLGNKEDFVIDESLVAVVGMAVDNTNNWLIVCNSDSGLSLRSDPATIGQLAEVIIYDLTTGKKIRTTKLNTLYQGGHFINDVISDHNGNIYATDSFSPVIYKIDSKGVASVLVSDDRFIVPQGAFGLNGIVYHPDNYLIVGLAFGGRLFKIPLENPNNIEEVSLSKSVNSLDGMLLSDENTLVLVSNNFTGAPFTEAVYKLVSSDNWNNASIQSTFTNFAGSFPTTVAKVNDAIFVNYAYFPDLLNPDTDVVEDFLLEKVLF